VLETWECDLRERTTTVIETIRRAHG